MPDDNGHLTTRDLKKKKLLLEVSLLQKQVAGEAPPKLKFWERISRYLQQNLGQIATIITLLGFFITPVWSYVSSQRQEKLIRINSDILQIVLAEDTTITNKDLMTISTQDPQVVAPILLDQLNKNRMSHKKAERIYKRMYEVNKDLTRYSLLDKILFLFMPDNQRVLERELSLNATRQFRKSFSPEAAKIAETYVNIIASLDLEEKKAFVAALDELTIKCQQDTAYRHLCKYRDEVLKKVTI